jgi:hypothetical protein
MIRAILAGGGVTLMLSPLVAALLWQGGSVSRMTSGQAVTVGIAALLGGIACLYFSRRWPPASSWILTIVGWIVGFFAFPMLMEVAAIPIILVASR